MSVIMRGINKVFLIGRLGSDPQVITFNNGSSITNISIATTENWVDKQTGNKIEQTEWHKIQLSNRLGEIASQYLRKGSIVYIEGSIHTRQYQDQNGITQFITAIKASEMQMLSSNNANSPPSKKSEVKENSPNPTTKNNMPVPKDRLDERFANLEQNKEKLKSKNSIDFGDVPF